MAAYAALVSLMHLIDDIQHHHSPPISLHKLQIQSLIEYVIFLQEFLQAYKSPVSDCDEADPLEMRIAKAAYAAEDVIESRIVQKIQHSRSKATKITSFFNWFRGPKDPTKLYQEVQNVIDEMDRIKRVAIETNSEKAVVLHDRRRRFVSSCSGMTVFSDDVLNGIIEKLVADERSRQVIPITGMGGIGKTALAQSIYSKQVIKERFDVCAWATISKQFNIREILCELVSQVTNQNKEQLSEMSEDKLGSDLHKYLFGRRFLIVMDDIWDIESWNEIQRFFPSNEDSSRIMVTTRQSQLASQLNSHYSHSMEFLDEASSWILFSKTVFEEEPFPLHLEKVGKEIAYNCRGLPLSIVVVGGILKNMERTQECWESIRNNLTSVVNLDNDKHCLRLLKMSYDHLSVYLKPCFLYMGVFEKDDSISVSKLIELWVSEGFLKPIDGKSLETVGRGFLKDLVDRNLILVSELGSTRNIKVVKVHDLVRDLCLNEAKKEGFYHVIGESSPRDINNQRRIVIPRNTSKKKVLDDFQSLSCARSIICEHRNVPRCRNFGLLRTIHRYRNHTSENGSYVNSRVSGYVNLRHLVVKVNNISSISSSLNHLWNLHTLIVSCQHKSTAPTISCLHKSTAPTDIWKMLQLRRIEMLHSRFLLPDPSSGVVVMENLVVLEGALNFMCDEEMVKRIPNIKKLRITYLETKGMSGNDYYCLGNIKRLCKLESLYIYCGYDFRGNDSIYKLTFPQTLKRLTLDMENDFEWEMMLEKIGSLPFLEKFKLRCGCFRTGKWKIFEGQFPCLKYLELYWCPSLKHWTAEASSIFPRLEKLLFHYLDELENIPFEIGDIPTLQSIHMVDCGESVVKCAKEIVKEQMDLQGDDLPFHVHVRLTCDKNEAIQSLAGPNFEVV